MKHSSTMAVRGSLSIGLGLAVLLWPAPGLGELVVLFGMYALLDGIAAATWAVRVSRRSPADWALLLGEAVFSVGLGVVALGFPLQSALFVQVVALWGFVTGTLEVLSGLVLARRAAAHWFLVAAGAWSLFLAVLVLSLPHALAQGLVIAIGAYALAFGVLVSLSAFRLRRWFRRCPWQPSSRHERRGHRGWPVAPRDRPPRTRRASSAGVGTLDARYASTVGGRRLRAGASRDRHARPHRR